MAPSPSSYFLFLLNSHQLIYLPKTPYAPSVGEFASTVRSFIKRKHVAEFFLQRLLKPAVATYLLSWAPAGLR